MKLFSHSLTLLVLSLSFIVSPLSVGDEKNLDETKFCVLETSSENFLRISAASAEEKVKLYETRGVSAGDLNQVIEALEKLKNLEICSQVVVRKLQ